MARAAWLFVIWGAWHGLLLLATHALRRRGILSPDARPSVCWLRRQVTFALVVVGWVFFRAADVPKGTYGLGSIAPAFQMFSEMLGNRGFWADAVVTMPDALFWPLLLSCWLWCNFAPNSYEWVYGREYRLAIRYAWAAGLMFTMCVLRLGTPVDFLYFRF